jgi:hypothetical protein
MTIKRLSLEREIRQWTAFLGRLENGSAQIAVPHLGVGNPWPAGYVGPLPGVTHSDGTSFSDGSLYRTKSIAYELVDAVASRAREMRLRRIYGGNLMGGEFFTLEGGEFGPRLHYISQVKEISGDVFTVRIGNPPLRQGYAAGTFADFESPRCLMKANVESLADAWMEIERPYRGTPRIIFEETDNVV